MAFPGFSAYWSGIALGASLIIAIGAQNAFVLRQGLRREHVLPVVLVCVACDVALISLGCAGFGALVKRVPAMVDIAAWGGAAFLSMHGALSLRSALHPGSLTAEKAAALAHASGRSAALAALGLSLLNPHVYLDTVVLLGSIGAQYPVPARVWFAAGAITASIGWFFSLGFGARLLSPLFAKPVAWRVLDLVVAGVMWWIAGSLVWGRIFG